ncbi:hypothetical protein MTP99_013157 [Tenebrio molitor]|nr:hypothetical protein MTP99_013157 [Tenebrio molitor]
MNDIEAQEASDCQENVLNSSGENHTLSPSKICDNCSEEATARNEKRLVSLSTSDYDALNGCIDFIDKSLFAWHFYHDPDNILLVTAPSRFGFGLVLWDIEYGRRGLTKYRDSWV